MSREIDAKVAEKVMGWREIVPFDGPWGVPNDGHDSNLRAPVPRYTTDASADCEVLKHVRETWEPTAIDKFEKALWVAWQIRLVVSNLAGFMAYQPGDYSRAALKALGEEV